MKYLISTSIAAIMALSMPFMASAAIVLYMPQGTVLTNVGSPNPTFGATTTATANVSASQTLYIAYCVTIFNGNVPAQFHSEASQSFNYNLIAADPDLPFVGTDQQYCRNATTSASLLMTAGTDYFVSFPINGVFGGQTTDLNSSGDFYELSDSPIIPPSNSTHIIVTVPANNATTSTSTSATIGARINVNTQEWIDALAANNGNWFMQISLQRNTPIVRQLDGPFDFLAKSILGINRPVRTYTFPINNSGLLVYSTTTDLSLEGAYYMTTQIIRPAPFGTVLSWVGFGSAKVLDATSTVFLASNATGWDTLGASTSDAISNFVASSSQELASSCFTWSGSALGDCLNLLFIPQSADLGRLLNDLNNGLFSYAPWGYVTRMVNILSSQATSSFPLINTGIPDPTNPHQLMAFHYDPNEALLGAAAMMDTIRDPVTNENPREGLELIVRTVVALSVISIIFYDLTGGRSRGRISGARTKLS